MAGVTIDFRSTIVEEPKGMAAGYRLDHHDRDHGREILHGCYHDPSEVAGHEWAAIRWPVVCPISE